MKHFFVGFVALITLSACGSGGAQIVETPQMDMAGMPCHQMPDGSMMGDCDGEMMGHGDGSNHEGSVGAFFSQDIEGLSSSKPSEIIALEDGDRFELVAQEVVHTVHGKDVKMLAYNGMIPGPMFMVQRGAQVTIDFLNQTDHETMLHSHGLRLENAFDGTALTQEPIPPGGSFVYELTFPDTGMYWYHPHMREDYSQEMGLYGHYLVTDEDATYWNPVNREVPLILDDLLLENGRVLPFYEDKASHALMGRYGNTPFLNGETDYRLDLVAGEVVRFYITNVANARPFQLSIPGVQLKLVGGDASRVERELFVDSVTIAPSERIVVEASFSEPGTFLLTNLPSQTMTYLGHVVVKEGELSDSFAQAFQALRTNDDVISSIDPFRQYFDRSPDKILRMDMSMMGMDHAMMGEALHGIEWDDEMRQMNELSTSETVHWNLVDEETGKENMDIDWTFQQGEVVKIRLFNDPGSMHPMQHPIHLHGQRFLVLERDGVRQDNLTWKDTALVETGETVDLLVDMSNPGEWMLHCHIAEHLEAGMMLGFTVQP